MSELKPVIDIEMKVPLYMVRAWVAFRGQVNGPWRQTMRDALKAWAELFLREDLDEGRIMQVRLVDNTKYGYNQNVLTQPYMRIALIEDGLGLEDPRIPPGVEYLHVMKGTELSPGLAADGWKYVGSDTQWPKLYDLYGREKKKT